MGTTFASPLPLLAVAVSLAAVPAILLSAKNRNLREFWTLAASLAKFAVVLSLLPAVLDGRLAETRLFELAPGVRLALKADAAGVFFALVASGLWILTSVYNIGYMRGLRERKQTRYYASFAVCLSSTVGVAFAANLLTFVLFYEILTVATYPLVVHKESAEAIRAGRKYLAYTLSAGVLLIAATAMIWLTAGRLEFVPGGFLSGSSLSAGTLKALFLLLLGGVGVKASIMPLHGWLPTAMVAPTPVSALLHAVAVVKSGVFGVVRVTGFVFGPRLMADMEFDTLLAGFAAATILTASLLAFREDNLKRRLAYSTVGHLSYIVLGMALVAPAAAAGSLLHLAFHATLKITLFFCAGAIYVNLHKDKVSELDGVGRIMPWTMAAFTLGAIGLAGIPPLNGFVSKWSLGLGALQAGRPTALALLVLSGILNAGYFFPIVRRAFFKKGAFPPGAREAAPTMVAPLVVTAGLSLALGLYPDLFFRFYRLASAVAASVFGGPGP
ncbi:MAG: monovalent cation/H+ antiporter subunit D family protein [Candidatus Aminicenantes bacterium]|nr:monovalent cation/H+ antiporter subunit D family protein [Candidatus Aminicenantes bacterium]